MANAYSLPIEPQANINISAYRVLFILFLLIRHRSLNVLELNRFLCENEWIGRSYNADTLTKYMNTLRELGCRIPRSTNRNEYRYELLKNPFPLQLSWQEVEVMQKLSRLLRAQPDETLSQDYQNLLEELDWFTRVEPEHSHMAELHDEEDDLPGGLLWGESSRINYQRLKKLCKDGLMLQIIYQPKGEPEARSILFEPYDVTHRAEAIYLVGLDTSIQTQCLLESDAIQSIDQLPTKNRRPPSLQTATFALYGRLASSYRLYPGEKVVFRDAHQIHIKVRAVEFSSLVSRLMKYGDACQILSPKSLRQDIRARIERLLDGLSANF